VLYALSPGWFGRCQHRVLHLSPATATERRTTLSNHKHQGSGINDELHACWLQEGPGQTAALPRYGFAKNSWRMKITGSRSIYWYRQSPSWGRSERCLRNGAWIYSIPFRKSFKPVKTFELRDFTAFAVLQIFLSPILSAVTQRNGNNHQSQDQITY